VLRYNKGGENIKREYEIELIGEGFEKVGHGLAVIGDETRQKIILTLLGENCYPGMRVGEITEKVCLSRPAVSHHLRILKEEKIIGMREEGTKNYYYLSPDESRLTDLKKLVDQIDALLHDPSRRIEK